MQVNAVKIAKHESIEARHAVKGVTRPRNCHGESNRTNELDIEDLARDTKLDVRGQCKPQEFVGADLTAVGIVGVPSTLLPSIDPKGIKPLEIETLIH